MSENSAMGLFNHDLIIKILCLLLVWGGAATAKQPNVVLIVADDLGYADAGFTMTYAMAMRSSDYLGRPWDPQPLAEVHTPNIDRLADQAVIFTNGYVTGYVCSPTRAGFMLGRYQQRVGIYGAGDGGLGMNVYEDKRHSASGRDYPRINPILPEFLKQTSRAFRPYVCGVFGKWHLGTDGISEVRQGVLATDGRPRKQDTPYIAIGDHYEVPNVARPIANADGNTDPMWIGGSPWHCANRGFDEFFYFMGRGAHDYWNPNAIYDSLDSDHRLRRTVGYDHRLNPGYGQDGDVQVPLESWNATSPPYVIHSERIPQNYLTVRLTDAACDFIQKHAGGAQPFLCYVPFNAAHSPSQAPYHFDPVTSRLDALGTDTRRYYVLDDLGRPLRRLTPADVADWFDPKKPDPNWFPDPLYLYETFKGNPQAFRYFSGGTGQQPVKKDSDIRQRCITLAMVQWMDKGIGRILQTLKDEEVYDDTIVLFISDNGGATGMRATNAPLRGNKHTQWEGGIRSPFLFSWPAFLKAQNGTQVLDDQQVAKRQLIHAPVTALDFLPTLLAINGLDSLVPDPLLDADTQTHYRYDPDGKNLMPLIRGELDSLHDYLFWADNQEVAHGVVRKGQWKLHLLPDAKMELYHLSEDIAETTNRADDFPELVDELRQAYVDFMNTCAENMRQEVPNSRIHPDHLNPPPKTVIRRK